MVALPQVISNRRYTIGQRRHVFHPCCAGVGQSARETPTFLGEAGEVSMRVPPWHPNSANPAIKPPTSTNKPHQVNKSGHEPRWLASQLHTVLNIVEVCWGHIQLIDDGSNDHGVIIAFSAPPKPALSGEARNVSPALSPGLLSQQIQATPRPLMSTEGLIHHHVRNQHFASEIWLFETNPPQIRINELILGRFLLTNYNT